MRGSNPASWQARRNSRASGQVRPVASIHGSEEKSDIDRPGASHSAMPGRQGHVHGVIEQGHDLQVGRGRLGGDVARRIAARVVRQRQVELAGAQARDRLLRIEHRHRELHPGMAVTEAGHGARHDRAGRRGERGQAQRPALHAQQRVQLVLDVVQGGQDRRAALGQQAAGVGEHRALGDAAHQHRADLGLERGDLARDRRLGVAERLGGRREGPVARHLAQHSQSSSVEHA